MNTIASFVSIVAADPSMHTRIMPVLSTATEGEHVEGAGSEAGDSGLKGYRKR